MKALECRIPPPIVAGLTAALMWVVARSARGISIHLPARGWIEFALTVSGVLMAAWGVITFRRSGTTVDPTKPGKASALVRSSPYRITRNPMYVGLLVILTGWAAYLGNSLSLLLLPAFVVYMNRFQIQPEEAALAAIFGKEFLEYKGRVRRWL